VIHLILPVGLLQCNCSIFGDEQTHEAIVVDPGDEIEKIVTELNAHTLKVKAIVITHAHIDHVAGAHQLRALTGAPVYMNARDRELLKALDVQARWLGVPEPPRTQIDVDAQEGTLLALGQTEFQLLDTPGHTEGSISVYIPSQRKVIAGDTLFRRSIGRTDLPGGDARRILSSIKTRLFELPDDTVVIPGHGPNTTIQEEKASNPFLQQL
jgi:hydroxyacylglutathione hydrolase